MPEDKDTEEKKPFIIIITGNTNSVINVSSSLEGVSQDIDALSERAPELKALIEAHWENEVLPALRRAQEQSDQEQSDQEQSDQEQVGEVIKVISALARVLRADHNRVASRHMLAGLEQQALEAAQGLPEVRPAVSDLFVEVCETVNNDPDPIAFTDRDDVLRTFKSSSGVLRYYLLDAPFGYGKTRLLEKLQRELQQEQNVCAMVRFDQQRFQSVDEVVSALGAQIEGYRQPDPGERPRRRDHLPLLSAAVREALHRHQSVTLIFDAIEHLTNDDYPPEFYPAVVDIPVRIVDSLRGIPSLHTFQAIFAGRNIEVSLSPLFKRSGALLTPQPLSPFNDTVIGLATRRTMEDLKLSFSDQEIQEISWYILRHTGGHPKCIAHVLSDLAFDYFGDWRNYFATIYPEEIYDKVIEPIVQEILTSVPEQLRPLLELLSPFRHFEWETLSYLASNGMLPNTPTLELNDAYDLVMELVKTSLCDYDDSQCQYTAHMVRQLLVLKLARNRDTFLQLCDLAERYYWSKIQRAEWDGKAERNLIEITYQQLQRFLLLGPAERPPAGEMSKALAAILRRCFVGTGSAVRAARIKELAAILKRDWEWHYLVRELLGPKGYDDLLCLLQQEA